MWAKAIEEIRKASSESTVYVGCDSIRYSEGKHPNKKWFAKYSTVVVLHVDSKHGGKIFHHTVTEPDYGSLRVRLLREVQFTIDAAECIAPHLNGKKLEIHLDINDDPKHASSIVIKEAIGWVQSMGYVAKGKPDGWAATHAADHCVRK